MNEALKNIFDEDSLNAIKNAHQVVPTPRCALRVGNVVAGLSDQSEVQEEIETKKEEPIIQSNEQEVNYEVSNAYEGRIKELNNMIDQHASIINNLIKSQNDLISQITELKNRKPEVIETIRIENSGVQESSQISNRVVEKQVRPEEKKKVEIVEIGKEFEEETPQKAEKVKQQTSACGNLNPDDYSVEKIFYFGNK